MSFVSQWSVTRFCDKTERLKYMPTYLNFKGSKVTNLDFDYIRGLSKFVGSIEIINSDILSWFMSCCRS